MAGRDPAAAIAWADAIGDPGLRETALTTVAVSYLENQPEAAAAWLPESGLPVATRQRILDPPPADRHRVDFFTQN